MQPARAAPEGPKQPDSVAQAGVMVAPRNPTLGAKQG